MKSKNLRVAVLASMIVLSMTGTTAFAAPDNSTTDEVISTDSTDTTGNTDSADSTEVVGVVDVTTFLYVRSQPTTESEDIGTLYAGDVAVVLEELDGWYKIQAGDLEGYVSADYLLVADNDSTGEAVVDYAIQFLGNPYVWGGTSLTNGCDCSGFVMSVYEHFGVSLPHSSSALRSVGYEVSVDEILAGDIVCYDGHVGIYVGDDMMINASSSSTGIIYTNIYYRNILSVRRIF